MTVKMDILDQLRDPEQICRLSGSECEALAAEVRDLIIRTVAANGGHLASNLGMVELTIALLRSFDFKRDQVIFDVGHQVYAWKILTGRRDLFCTLRRSEGLSGFPKTEESRYDFFNTGHSSTSISAALGLRRAADHRGRACKVLAVIGDGALSGGEAFEALNDAGHRKENLIVILNDNQMSISRNVGGLSRHLENLRISRGYMRVKSGVDLVLRKLPLIGRPLLRLLFAVKRMTHMLLHSGSIYFEKLGFRYYGPVDGHDLSGLEEHLRRIADIEGPVILHVVTQKGRGYAYAEKDPDIYHGVAPFSVETGITAKPESAVHPASFSEAFGQRLIQMAERNPRICAISAAMTAGTGLTRFAQTYPSRFYDVGIAEQHAMTLAAGLAAGGMRPFIALYSTFFQRCYDQMLHDVCLQGLPVTVLLDRAGIVGEDGETHQGIYDLGLLLPLPGVTILCPADFTDLYAALQFAQTATGPVVIRYPRGGNPRRELPGSRPMNLLDARVLRHGQSCTLAVLGTLTDQALDCADLLASEGLSIDVLSLVCAKPYDQKSLIRSAERTGRLLIAEETALIGGLGQRILADLQRAVPNLSIELAGIPDQPLCQGKRDALLKHIGLDAASLAERIRKMVYSV